MIGRDSWTVLTRRLNLMAGLSEVEVWVCSKELYQGSSIVRSLFVRFLLKGSIFFSLELPMPSKLNPKLQKTPKTLKPLNLRSAVETCIEE